MKFVKREKDYYLYPESDGESRWAVRNFLNRNRKLKARLQGNEKEGLYVQIRFDDDNEGGTPDGNA